MKYTYLWYLLILVFLAGGCNSSTIPTGDVSATVIEYKVNYLTDKAGNIPTKMLPGKMTVIFADHYALNKIEGFFGQFSLVYIGNLKNKSVITMLKLFDKKYVSYGKSGEMPCGFSELNNLTINETGKVVDFMGFSCKQLEISSDKDSAFIALCTDKIDVKNPNITTPYKEIDEVLLDFRTHLSLLHMQLSATNIETKTISWDTFRVPEEYKERPSEFLENTIQELFK